MPASRGDSGAGADPAKVAEWRSRTFRGLRPPTSTGTHDRLPLEPLDDPDAAIAAISAE